MLVNTGFDTRKSFSENYPQIGHALSKRFTNNENFQRMSVLRGAKLSACLRHQVINLYSAPKFWPALSLEDYFMGHDDMEVSKMN